jgi:hypothetical protein
MKESSNSSKQARFASVVEACGRPQVAVLWSRPQKDKAFMVAVRQVRVMTITQEQSGARKDFGHVGLIREKNASYFVFPKPLTRFRNRRIVGINYDLVKDSGLVGPLVPSLKPTRHARPKPALRRNTSFFEDKPISESDTRKFKVVLRFTSTVEVCREIEAESGNKALAQAVECSKMPEFSRGTVTRKVVRVVAAD